VTSGKQLYEGKEYDYVFSVELTEGLPPLKLPFNVIEDPWHAARRFLEANELDPQFLEQVANFIIQNTAGVQLGSAAGNPDPFTGSEGPAPTGRASFDLRDTPKSSNIGNLDPYTGSSTVSNGDISSTIYFPLKECVCLFKPNYAKDVEKILEFNLRTSNPLNTEAVQRLTTGTYTTESADLVLKALSSWEHDLVFPFWDIAVGFVSNPEFCGKLTLNIDELLSRIMELKNAGKATQTMALRLVANLSSLQQSRDSLFNSAECVNVIETFALIHSASVSVALATLTMNLCVHAHLTGSEVSLLSLVPVFPAMLSSDLPDEETCFRTLVGVGTLLSNCDIMRDAVKSSEFAAVCQSMRQKTSSHKVKECGNAVLNVLKSS
jgi:phospholipase A-2-activating protein